MAAKIILVTHAPTKGGKPLDGASGRRLAALAGLDQADLVSRFEVRSVLEEPWGPLLPRGTSQAARAAREAEAVRRIAIERAAGDIMRAGFAGRKMVLIGREVAVAFRLSKGEQYNWFDPIEIEPGIETAVIPHPGGVAGWWNDDGNEARAREFMLALNVGFLGPPKRVGKQQFTVAQVAAALEAGRGVYTWAAKALHEATGRNCCSETIKAYVERYHPKQLKPVHDRTRISLAGMVVHKLIAKAEAGETAVLRDLAGMKFIQDVAREQLGVDLRKMVGVEHSGAVKHEITVQVEDAWNRIVATIEGEAERVEH